MINESLRILIVEDEPLIASGISCCLTELGYETVGIASDGNEALELAVRQLPDLILMDINIPEMDGIIVMERLNEKYPIPCVFLTGYSDQGLIKRARSVSAYGYLIKPVDIHDLDAAISIAVSRFREMKKSITLQLATQHALEDRKLIDRAKGILMDEFSLKEAQAMRYLQKKSRDLNKKLPVLAQEIIYTHQKASK